MNTGNLLIDATDRWRATDIKAGIGGIEFIEDEIAGCADAPQSQDSAYKGDQQEAKNIFSVPVPCAPFIHVWLDPLRFMLYPIFDAECSGSSM